MANVFRQLFADKDKTVKLYPNTLLKRIWTDKNHNLGNMIHDKDGTNLTLGNPSEYTDIQFATSGKNGNAKLSDFATNADLNKIDEYPLTIEGISSGNIYCYVKSGIAYVTGNFSTSSTSLKVTGLPAPKYGTYIPLVDTSSSNGNRAVGLSGTSFTREVVNVHQYTLNASYIVA